MRDYGERPRSEPSCGSDQPPLAAYRSTTVIHAWTVLVRRSALLSHLLLRLLSLLTCRPCDRPTSYSYLESACMRLFPDTFLEERVAPRNMLRSHVSQIKVLYY